MTDHPEYTLTQPPICPRKWDHLTDLTVEDAHACIRYAIALVGAEDIRLRPTTE